MQKDHRPLFSPTKARLRAVFAVLCLVIAGVCALIPRTLVFAQTVQSQQNVSQVASAAGVQTGDLPTMIGRIIYIFLSVIGTVLLGYLIYGGYLYMTAAGDPKKTEAGTSVIRNAIIGIIIIAASFAITTYILGQLAAMTGGGVQGNGKQDFNQLANFSGALGNRIEYHLPTRDATGVSRSTAIIITFVDPVNPASFIAGWTPENEGKVKGLNTDNIKILKSVDVATPDALTNNILKTDQAIVRYTKDHKTFVIRPTDNLGSNTENVKYTVFLKGGAQGVLNDKGGATFTGNFGNQFKNGFETGYMWQFEVSTIVDLTPPKVIAAIPVAGGEYPRNTVIDVVFDEAIDPTSATGEVKNGKGFSNLEIRVGNSLLDGNYKIANQYRTVEFLTTDMCGINSCGKNIYCLPPNASINVVVHAATLADPNLPKALFYDNEPFVDGVIDVSANSLDGNGNDKAEGRLKDDYPDAKGEPWTFKTTAAIKKTGPLIESTVPDAFVGGNRSNRPLDERVSATFDSLLQASTVDSQSVKLVASGWTEVDPNTWWFYTGTEYLNQKGLPLKKGDIPVKAQTTLTHRPYLPSGGANKLNYYDPFLTSDVQDIYQNCFNPAGSQSNNPNATCAANGNAPNCCNSVPGAKDCKF